MLPLAGSSPRVRSRRHRRHRQHSGSRIISACAEQTNRPAATGTRSWDHLRVCGADNSPTCKKFIRSGSSPRVRSRLPVVRMADEIHGIISACAEQTGTTVRSSRTRRDHLRVCGADLGGSIFVSGAGGSSPRVRSRRHQGRGHRATAGIISACAEQTLRRRHPHRRIPDHLRVCGADGLPPIRAYISAGSSPRVRSRLIAVSVEVRILRIISACAEQTAAGTSSIFASLDHLRVCGADFCGPLLGVALAGSSPRVRSRLRYCHRTAANTRIISACAEQTWSKA